MYLAPTAAAAAGLPLFNNHRQQNLAEIWSS